MKKEDQLGWNAFVLTTICLTIFIILFIYNIIRCYTRSPAVTDKNTDVKSYSRELQTSSAVDDDSILDLTGA